MTNLITVKFGTKYGPEFVNKIYNDIKDQEIQIYNNEFNIVGSAYILKPINRRRN